MRRRQRGRELDGDIDDACDRKRLRHPVPQSAAFHQFGGDVMARVGFSDFEHRDDVRMIERRCCARLLLKAAHSILVACEVLREKFQCDETTELRIESGIDVSHPAATEIGIRSGNARWYGAQGGERLRPYLEDRSASG